MPLEIERKFLVSGEYKPLATSHSRIVQGYICSERGRTVRVRIRDSRGYLTIKGAATGNGLTRYEFEKEITLDEALSLLRLCEPGIIDKFRWLVPVGNHVFEVDEFMGDNAGLIILALIILLCIVVAVVSVAITITTASAAITDEDESEEE